VLTVKRILALNNARVIDIPELFINANSTSVSGTAGNSIGAYSRDVPSARTAPVAITQSPERTMVDIPPQVPMRMNV